MPNGFRLSHVFSVIACLAILAGCAGGSGNIPMSAIFPQSDGNGSAIQSGAHPAADPVGGLPAGMQAFAQPGATPPRNLINPTDRLPVNAFAFVADELLNVIYVLNHGGTIIATLSGDGLSCPAGLSVTNHPRKLYVANLCANDLLVYTSAGAPATLRQADIEIPGEVAVDNNGNVFVSNGGVTCFAPGATSRTRTITGISPYYGAFDASGNLYLIGAISGDPYFVVAEVIGGCATGTTITKLTTSNTIFSPGGIQVETDGNIAIENNGSGITPNAIFTYKPPIGGNLGSPITTTPLVTSSFISRFTFTPGSHLVLAANPALDQLDVYSFPRGGAPVQSVDLLGGMDAFPNGVAVSPSGQF